VKEGRPLAEVRGAFNAVSVVGDAVGPLFYHGLGAGQMPTASAVVADMIDMAVGRNQITFRTLELWSNREARVDMCDLSTLKGRFYLRFTVDDKPGVLADITGILGKNQISIASVMQHEPDGDEPANSSQPMVPLIIMTHSALEGSVAKAVAEIGRLGSVKQCAARMRVME
jgi:homoserine dehydrogenase